MSELSVDLLSSLIDYDPISGRMTWKERPLHLFQRRRLGLTWNTRYAGTPALDRVDEHGYRAGSIFGRKVYAHRAAVALLTGSWPDKVDHINGDKSDNRGDNLREVDHAGNMRNTKLRRDNRSGVCGVFWNTRDELWDARIKVGGHIVALGQYDDLDAARHARKRAERSYGFHENHGRAA